MDNVLAADDPISSHMESNLLILQSIGNIYRLTIQKIVTTF